MAVASETGRLRTVLVHGPGREVEQMTPGTAQELLYNEIVPIESVQQEHRELRAVLSLVARTVEVTGALEEIASGPDGIAALAAGLAAGDGEVRERLLQRWHGAEPATIRSDCICGVPRDAVRLTDVYRRDRFLIPPIPNLYFTRDAAFVVHDRGYRAVMAGGVRAGEAAIMAQILATLGVAVDEHLSRRARGDGTMRVEGGDVLVLDRDTLVIGLGERSSAAGIDALLESIAGERETPLRVVVVELPEERATIHLDMIATVIGPGSLLGYRPLLEGRDARRVFTITVPPGYGGRWEITEHEDLLHGLDAVGRPHRIIPCGGDHEVTREREQWFSACNSVAVGPQHVVVYRNNPATLDALANGGSIPRMRCSFYRSCSWTMRVSWFPARLRSPWTVWNLPAAAVDPAV
jgi:arginine deiminase